MKKIIVIFLFIFLSTEYAYSEIIAEGAIPSSFRDNKQPLAEDIIVCEFQTISTFTYKETNKIYFNVSTDKSPVIITFTGLNTKKPQVKNIAGTFSLRISRSNNDFIALEQKPTYNNDIIFYTIYKKEKVATLHMIFSSITVPTSFLSMGYCY